MDTTIVPFAREPGEPGRHALVLLDAARTWRRPSGRNVPFPDTIVRRMGAAGLLNALAPLDVLMLVLAAHAREPLDLGRSEDTPYPAPDARLLAWVLDEALAGEVSEDAVDRLALRVDMGARALVRATVCRLARAARPRVERGIWPGSGLRHVPDLDPADDSADDPGLGPVLAPASLLAAE